jgi:uncharacterized protein (DUF2267 family)
MRHEGIDVFDQTSIKAKEWIDELLTELRWTDPHHALGAFRAVIHTFRDRLPVSEAAQLAAQMPTLIRGVYFEGWRPHVRPPVIRHREELVALLEEQLACYGLHGSETFTHVARAVLRVVNRHISAGEIDEARHALPAELRVFWPGQNGTPVHG